VDLLFVARIEGCEKYMYHYGKEPEEFYDPRKDPLERDDSSTGRARRSWLACARSSCNGVWRPPDYTIAPTPERESREMAKEPESSSELDVFP
jgi:hypothetical protein